ncbi:MAG: isoprenylcysteine carboxyl methyltransferase family protein [Myxococcota bacterium]
MIPYLIFLAAVGAQRIGELLVSRRHTRWSLARGGIEVGRGHFLAMKALHAAFRVACALEAVWLHRPFVRWLGAPMLGLALAAQALRLWSLRSLGERWNARVIVVPGAPVVARGPYRFVRHPNYLAVAVEALAIPLVHGAWITALTFSVLNAGLLTVRVRCEERALAAHCPDPAGIGRLPRFVPRMSRA